MTVEHCIDEASMQWMSAKAAELTHWLAKNAPDCETSQKHLEAGTAEQIYWHYGYLCATKDVLAPLEKRSAE